MQLLDMIHEDTVDTAGIELHQLRMHLSEEVKFFLTRPLRPYSVLIDWGSPSMMEEPEWIVSLDDAWWFGR